MMILICIELGMPEGLVLKQLRPGLHLISSHQWLNSTHSVKSGHN